MKKLHLLCNAHLDPAWLWELEEGAGEALSTFRIAANFCEQYDGFVFNHNEVILYEWIEQFDPKLYKRIQNLVKEGKWNIMGGWYLQPDCNLPSGESFLRQILHGRNYFKEKFDKQPTTAINFDSFGHTKGLVQILAKSGYDSYIFCRPDQNDCPLPSNDFIWEGYDGSSVMGHRAFNAYLSGKGKAHSKVGKWMEEYPDKEVGLVLWGIGNHGGGPSKIDLDNLTELQASWEEFDIVHSTPEEYFSELKRLENLPTYQNDLNPWAPGCYTSQILIKQKHRQLENEIYMVEKMCSSASLQGLIEYPKENINQAVKDLLTAQFHDILAGTSIKAVEDSSLRLMDHGLETLSREKLKAFFALTSGEDKPNEDELPIFVYNPHPYKIKTIIECEFQLPKSSKDKFTQPVIFKDGVQILSQVEQEESNLYIDWRKKVSFVAELDPSQMNRFDCTVNLLEEKPKPTLMKENDFIEFQTEELHIIINCRTGLIDKYAVNGIDYLKEASFLPIVVDDNEDSWGSQVKSFPSKVGKFKLMSPAQSAKMSGVQASTLAPVRVIEDGEVRSIIEVMFEYGNSTICQRFKLPKKGAEIEVELITHWLEKGKMLKLSVPTLFEEGKYFGQVAYGSDELEQNHREVVSQKWNCIVNESEQLAFSCINDGVYGSDVNNGEVRLSLLRSAGYSSLIGGDKNTVIPQDRFSNRLDQGERHFKFWFNASKLNERMEKVNHEALIHNEKPYALSYFPSGEGDKTNGLIELSDHSVELSVIKQAESTDDFIIRLFETTGESRKVTVSLPFLDVKETVKLKPYEIKTFLLDTKDECLIETDLLEKPIMAHANTVMED
ncbi:glycoside hydrolase family 38 N-terminal domain-containing protein [Pontibacillus marinus]|uniref:Glycoside hydrolase family 38 central domain-containing protein n=1 Tax=Pontibacillus marinus BH030004 = DSM 16465 TaxID=1385511 RepID=A0A0A5FUX5_9BACI|nr:alpha-mannosidase [Pontibacillus marinus]KGX84566.1 hypothetical protein N783_16645 [Pontibacillus marinus BH030004 = DSM 16465]